MAAIPDREGGNFLNFRLDQGWGEAQDHGGLLSKLDKFPGAGHLATRTGQFVLGERSDLPHSIGRYDNLPFCRPNSSLRAHSLKLFFAHLVSYFRLPDKLFRDMVADQYCSGVPASAIPYNCLVRVSTEWIDSFQIVYLSAVSQGRHGVMASPL